RPIREIRGERATAVVPCIVEPGQVAQRRDRSDGALRLVSTGGLIERKDPLLAVEVLARLVSRGVDAHLEWLGEGPLRGAVEELARERGVEGRLALPGSRSSAEVREALGRADLFFGPTRADNFFVSAAEAIVAGRPVVLGATGGQGEYVQPQVGALVDRQDATAYTEAILEVDARTRTLPAQDIADTIGSAFSEATVGAAYARAQQLTRTTGAPFPVRPAAAGSEDVTVAGDIEGADDVQGAAGDVEGAAGDTPPSLLVLSFSDISRDARVLKQVTMLSTDYRVMTCGYGPTPEGS